MKITGIFLLLFHALNLCAQDISRELDFLDTQNTIVDPFSIPLYISGDGDVTLLFRDTDSISSFNLLAQAQASFNKSIYISPVRSEEFGFFDQLKGLSWIETKRERYEGGLGISASAYGISLGLSTYQGALQTMVRIKKTPNEVTKRPLLPDRLDEISQWRVGDKGSFQRFGGVQVSVGYGVSVLTLASFGIVFQNLWSVGLERLSSGKVALTLAEEGLKKRKLLTGTSVSTLEAQFFNGNRLTIQFELDPENAEHHDLYKLAMKGEILKLQERLPLEAQKIIWKGSERLAYLGIPAVIGRHTLRSEYVLQYGDNLEEDVLDLRAKRNSGFLIPVRSHNRFVYQNHDSITLIWHSFMSKVTSELLDKYFLKAGREIGVKGFNVGLPEKSKLGATVSQLSMSFSREEIEKIDHDFLDKLLGHFEQRCGKLKLSCVHPKKIKRLSKKLHSFPGKKWEDIRDEFGFALIDNPALINSYLKTMGAKKKVSFRFLNQTYQSLEGTAPIEI